MEIKELLSLFKNKVACMYYFTSEAVSPGHPDKIADQVSDLCLDYFLEKDSHARVAVETMVTPQKIILAGEFRSSFEPDFRELEKRIRQAIHEIGYESGIFNSKDVEIEFILNPQSPDIAVGVDAKENKSEGAGDQGIMFGYATDETKDLMPACLYYAHKILFHIHEKTQQGTLKGLGPDAKSQVTMHYDAEDKSNGIDTILVSIKHDEALGQEDVKERLMPVIKEVVPEKLLTHTKFLFNPTGRYTIGGPESDVGLTGRKIIVDTYGGAAPHGGGAFSGKDPTKVDRSAAYMGRYLAKNIVAAGLARRCLIQLSYAIGVPEPVSIYLNTHGTSEVPEKEIIQWIQDHVDLTPRGIRERLQLARPIYFSTARFGHFGRPFDAGKGLFTWEDTDLTEDLKEHFFKGNPLHKAVCA